MLTFGFVAELLSAGGSGRSPTALWEKKDLFRNQKMILTEKEK